jgi:hypothetical protein
MKGIVEKGKLTEIVLVCLIIAVSVYIANTQGYKVGYAQGDESGYLRGYDEGDTVGYVRGHDVGYIEGNETGYGLGYSIGESYGYTTGYSKGNTIGYSSGLKVGNEQGYTKGYSTGYTSGNSIGYSEGYSKGLTTGTKWVDPTYRQMTDFLASDTTNSLVYHDFTFVCSDFAATLSKNAYKLGYRCFAVSLWFDVGAHMINAFNTTDRGFVYIEPQSDKVVQVSICLKYFVSNGYQAPSLDDTITKIVIIP